MHLVLGLVPSGKLVDEGSGVVALRSDDGTEQRCKFPSSASLPSGVAGATQHACEALRSGLPASVVLYSPAETFGTWQSAVDAVAVSHAADGGSVSVLATAGDQVHDLLNGGKIISNASTAQALATRKLGFNVSLPEAAINSSADLRRKTTDAMTVLQSVADQCQSTATGFVVVAIIRSGSTKATVMYLPTFNAVRTASSSDTWCKSQLHVVNVVSAAMQLVAREGEPKLVSWGENYVVNLLRDSFASSESGVTVVPVVVAGGDAALAEARCTLNFAETLLSDDEGKTIADYKTDIERLEERDDSTRRRTEESEAAVHESSAKVAEGRKLVDGLSRRFNTCMAEMEQELEHVVGNGADELESYRLGLLDRLQLVADTRSDELGKLRSATQQGTTTAESSAKSQMNAVRSGLRKRLLRLSEECEELKLELQDTEEVREELRHEKKQRQAAEHRLLIPVLEFEREAAELEKAVEAAGPNREDGLTREEIVASRFLWQTRDDVDEAEGEAEGLASRYLRLQHASVTGTGQPCTRDDSSCADTSPPDTDSVDSSDIGDDSDLGTGEAEGEGPTEAATEADRDNAKEHVMTQAEADELVAEYEGFRSVCQKDHELFHLIDDIVCFLEFGTPVTLVETAAFQRQFMFLDKTHQYLRLADLPARSQEADRSTYHTSISVSNVFGFVLGQCTLPFVSLLKMHGCAMDLPDSEAPHGSQLSPGNLRLFFYQSFSLQLKTKGRRSLDVIADTPADCEAWIVALHRLTKLYARWGQGITFDDNECRTLEPTEREFCEVNHIAPSLYFTAKQQLLLSSSTPYLSLHDIRGTVRLDLLHSQKMVEFFVCQGWVRRVDVRLLRHDRISEMKRALAQ